MKDHPITTETDRRCKYRILLDFLILLLLYTLIIVFDFFVKPFQRGFFCSDESIRYPLREATVSIFILAYIALALPVSLMLSVELTRYFCCDRTSKTRLLFGKNVPVWIVEFFKYLGCFMLGSVMTHHATEVTKYTIGRLRPFFMSVCQPVLADGSTCESPQNLHRYIEDYTCAAIGYSKNAVHNSRLSFPSGHSANTFYATIFLCIYLQHKCTWRGSRFLRPFLQYALLMLACFISLTRVMDYYHHWSDVVAGALLGMIMALASGILVVRNFRTEEWRDTEITKKPTTYTPTNAADEHGEINPVAERC